MPNNHPLTKHIIFPLKRSAFTEFTNWNDHFKNFCRDREGGLNSMIHAYLNSGMEFFNKRGISQWSDQPI